MSPLSFLPSSFPIIHLTNPQENSFRISPLEWGPVHRAPTFGISQMLNSITYKGQAEQRSSDFVCILSSWNILYFHKETWSFFSWNIQPLVKLSFAVLTDKNARTISFSSQFYSNVNNWQRTFWVTENIRPLKGYSAATVCQMEHGPGVAVLLDLLTFQETKIQIFLWKIMFSKCWCGRKKERSDCYCCLCRKKKT